MRIVSLNVAQLVGRSGFIPMAQLRAPKIAPRLGALLAAERPDVIALQEAPAKRGDFDPVAELMGPSPARVVRHAGPRHGPALLTRHRVTRASAQLFKQEGIDGKGWALAEIETKGGPLLVASIHLAVLSPGSRRKQVDRLAALLEPYPGLKVVVGDLNSGGDAPLYLAQQLGLVPHSAGPTFPSSRPTLRLDWAFTSETIHVRSVTSLSHLPSDHCAIRVDLELP